MLSGMGLDNTSVIFFGVGIDIYLYFPWIYCQLDTDTMLFFCSVSFFYYCGYLLQGALDGIIAFMDVCGFRCI